MYESKSIIQAKSFAFALKAIELYKELLGRNEYVLSKQFVRAATSIGANVSEALAGQSKKDFTAKMSIASKEAREASYWLRLLIESKYVSKTDLENELNEIVKMLTAIVKTSQLNTKN